MFKLILKNIADDISLNDLPYQWQNFDLDKFANKGIERLYSFQRESLENALKVLGLYFEKYSDFQEKENILVNEERKLKLFEEYKRWGLDESLVSYKYREERKHKFIFDYYETENNEISFRNFINRMSFWMATGSGKTIVIIKLIDILRRLIKNKEIPDYDILFLTHRDDLIQQFLDHLKIFNQDNQSPIAVVNLKEYENIKRLFKKDTVFYYRADNFTNEEKEKRVDFKNYFNDGKWYIILDEAHKGDKEESLRQHIFSILSKNGFLFNFSASFEDIRDLVSCVYEFNLSSFINDGYGKNIYISEYEAEAFRNKEEFDDSSKQKIVLKSLILFTYIKKHLEKIREIKNNLYHKPLVLVLVNSINQEIADLKLFFEEIRKIAKEEVDKNLFHQAKEELEREFGEEREFVFPNDESFKLDIDLINKINYDDILNYVFNSKSSGDIEISYNPSDKSEVALKLITSPEHFALIKTGEMPQWLKDSLNQFNVNHEFENEGFFKKLNREESSVNILLGSRVFYEGWDSNRPNLILFINIGLRKNAKKFVLQSIGRGVRIEPISGKRKRAKYLGDDFLIKNLNEFKNSLTAIETLFVFATSKEAISTILEEIKEFKKHTESKRKLSLFKNEERIKDEIILIPRYKFLGRKKFELEEKSRYSINESDFKSVQNFVQFMDDRVLLVNFETSPKLLQFFKQSLTQENREKFYKTDSHLEIKDPVKIINRIFNFWNEKVEEFERLKEIEEEIKHFKEIIVELEDNVFSGLEDLIKQTKDQKRNYLFGRDFELKYIPSHYYIPLISAVSDEEKISYIKHIIKIKSEIDFIEKLEKYLENKNNKFKEFDWWMFSKLDENLDEIYIPYYNYDVGKICRFIPDFIFWLRIKNNYYIVFIDPKGTLVRDFENKILGYKDLFEEQGRVKMFLYSKYPKNGVNFNCYINCFLYTDDKDKIKTSNYLDYWVENFDEMLEKVLNINNKND